jgi:hypothetical protein
MPETSNISDFIDIPKGYRRLGKFPLDAGSVFLADSIGEAKAKAVEYAAHGNLNGTAYKGQILAVMSNNVLEDPQLYTVNNEYGLTPLSMSGGSDTLYGEFPTDSTTGYPLGIKISAGFVINTISVTIDKAFSAPSVADGKIYFAITDGTVILADSNDIAFDEPGEYVIKCMTRVSSIDTIKFYNTSGSNDGSGHIKIN